MKKTIGHFLPQFGRQFWLLCLSTFLFFASFNVIIAELPEYLESLGGEEYKGLIISLFTLTAALSRPFSGKLADVIGRLPVMVFGALVCVGIGFLYPILSSVGGFLFLRLLHGFSTGFTPTGSSAYLADIIPIKKRGEAMGYLGFFNSMGMAIGPACGSYIFSVSNYNYLFFTSSFLALLSVIILWGMKETLPNKQKLSAKVFAINKNDIYEPQVLPPAIVMIFTVFSFGVILTLIPDLSRNLGINNKGTFFTIFTISSLFVRLLAGKASDRFGRVPVLIVSGAILAFAMYYLAFVTTAFQLKIGAVLFGIAVGINSPTIFAWTIDRCNIDHKARGLSTVFIAMEIGIGVGAFAAGWLYGTSSEKLYLPFLYAGIFCTISFFYLLINKLKGKFIY